MKKVENRCLSECSSSNGGVIYSNVKKILSTCQKLTTEPRPDVTAPAERRRQKRTQLVPHHHQHDHRTRFVRGAFGRDEEDNDAGLRSFSTQAQLDDDDVVVVYSTDATWFGSEINTNAL